MRNQPIAATKDKLEKPRFSSDDECSPGSPQRCQEAPRGKEKGNQQNRVLSPPQLGPTAAKVARPRSVLHIGLSFQCHLKLIISRTGKCMRNASLYTVSKNVNHLT